MAFDVTPESFRKEVARARTFGFMHDVTKLWSAGYALGATFDNTVVVSQDRVLNAEGLRFADEFVRHKALDAIGDLALAGLPLIGAYHSVRGGHKLNHAVLCALMADPSAWMVDAGRFAGQAAYPLVEIAARRRRGQADIAA
jgi:UDP-3-O-[3-hydroxymyristoyl] N-acetylglucosamine deacetylase